MMIRSDDKIIRLDRIGSVVFYDLTCKMTVSFQYNLNSSAACWMNIEGGRRNCSVGVKKQHKFSV
jgi:hypothetical protein